MPFWLDRLDEHQELHGAVDAPFLTAAPSEYFKRQCFITCDAGEELVWVVVEEVGEDVAMFSSDYPHGETKFPRSVETFLGLPKLSSSARRKLLWDNAARFYNLKGA